MQWRLPSQLVAVRDSLLRAVISPQMLYDCLGLHYLHPAVLPFLSPALSRTLGVQSLNAQQLMDIGQALVKQMSDSGDMDLAKVAHWLACMHNVMDDFDADDSVMDKLKQLPIIPASDGRLVSASQGNLFFPITHDTAAKNARKSMNTKFVNCCCIAMHLRFRDDAPGAERVLREPRSALLHC